MGSPQLSNQSINGASRVYGIIGFPVEHSLSPNFWNGAFRVLGMNAAYIPFPVKDEKHLKEAITGLHQLGVCGVNITAPYKEKAASLCNILHYPATSIGAVNTIKFSSNGIEGWNTDATALLSLLVKHQQFKTSTILGNGGVARSTVWALSKLGIQKNYVISRSNKPNFEKFANKLLPQSFEQISWSKENILKYASISDLAINATSLREDNSHQISELISSLSKKSLYVDFNYTKQSSKHKINSDSHLAISGKDLLMQQGIESFKILSDVEIPETIIRKFIYEE